MKKSLLHIVCALSCVLFSVGVEAQVQPSTACSGTVRIFNQSLDDWTINYYGNIVNIQEGTSVNLGLVDENPTLPRVIYLTRNRNCAYALPNSNAVWDAPCASETNSVSYYATYFTPGGIPLPGVITGSGQCFANSVIVID